MTITEQIKLALDIITNGQLTTVAGINTLHQALAKTGFYSEDANAGGIDLSKFKQTLQAPKPAAWMLDRYSPETGWWTEYAETEPDKGGWKPLYSHPAPAQKPLTEEQIELLAQEHEDGGLDSLATHQRLAATTLKGKAAYSTLSEQSKPHME
jgi:hypothetical protein